MEPFLVPNKTIVKTVGKHQVAVPLLKSATPLVIFLCPDYALKPGAQTLQIVYKWGAMNLPPGGNGDMIQVES